MSHAGSGAHLRTAGVTEGCPSLKRQPTGLALTISPPPLTSFKTTVTDTLVWWQEPTEGHSPSLTQLASWRVE